MAYNNKRPTNMKLTASINNIRKTGIIDPQQMLSNAKRMMNDIVRYSRRDYIAKTTKAGVDEFNDTSIRAKKGGIQASTKDLARFNKAKLIGKSAKPTFKGGVAGLALSALDVAASQGLLGKTIQQSSNQFQQQDDMAYQYAKDVLKRLTGK